MLVVIIVLELLFSKGKKDHNGHSNITLLSRATQYVAVMY